MLAGSGMSALGRLIGESRRLVSLLLATSGPGVRDEAVGAPSLGASSACFSTTFRRAGYVPSLPWTAQLAALASAIGSRAIRLSPLRQAERSSQSPAASIGPDRFAGPFPYGEDVKPGGATSSHPIATLAR